MKTCELKEIQRLRIFSFYFVENVCAADSVSPTYLLNYDYYENIDFLSNPVVKNLITDICIESNRQKRCLGHLTYLLKSHTSFGSIKFAFVTAKFDMYSPEAYLR